MGDFADQLRLIVDSVTEEAANVLLEKLKERVKNKNPENPGPFLRDTGTHTADTFRVERGVGEDGSPVFQIVSDAPHIDAYFDGGQKGDYPILPVNAKMLRWVSGWNFVFSNAVLHPANAPSTALDEAIEDFLQDFGDIYARGT